MSATAEAIAITKAAIDTMDGALGVYNRELDQIVSLKAYAVAVNQLDSYDYSSDGADLVGEIKALMTDALQNFARSTKSVDEWCGLTTDILAMYLDLLAKTSSNTYEAQRTFLIKVLDDAATKMTAGQATLEQMAVTFDAVAGKLIDLLSLLTKESDAKSNCFQANVNRMHSEDRVFELHRKLAEIRNFFVGFKTSVDRMNVGIGGVKGKLQADIVSIAEVKALVEKSVTVPMKSMDDVRHTVVGPVYNLIAQCNEYRERHRQ